MECRSLCAACCIAPSISSPLPGLPNGKPAGLPCPHLSSTLMCNLFKSPLRPKVCSSLKPSHDMCKTSQEEAYAFLTELELLTSP